MVHFNNLEMMSEEPGHLAPQEGPQPGGPCSYPSGLTAGRWAALRGLWSLPEAAFAAQTRFQSLYPASLTFLSLNTVSPHLTLA